MSRKGMSAERIARGILEEKGFKIIEQIWERGASDRALNNFLFLSLFCHR